jgi:hypothetical protein
MVGLGTLDLFLFFLFMLTNLIQMVLCSSTELLPLWPTGKPQVAAVPYGSVKLVLPILFMGQKRGIQPEGCIDNEEWCQKVGC